MSKHRLHWPFVAAGAIAAASLVLAVVKTNLQAACLTSEWGAPACPDTTADNLRSRLRSDIGDAFAWADLARVNPPARDSAVLAAAVRLAPREPNLQLTAAMAAAQANAWPDAVRLLVEIAEHSDDPRAPNALAHLVVAGKGPLLAPYLHADAHWLRLTLNELRRIPGGLAMAVPLMGQAVQAKALRADRIADDLIALRDQGAGRDAYSLWVAAHPSGLPLLYNGDFAEPINAGAFNWEFDAHQPRPGASVERVRDEKGVHLVEINFTGHAIRQPLLRQYVFLGPGRYRLSGQAAGSHLRLEDGLGWWLRCAGAQQRTVVGTLPVSASASEWATFDVEFAAPPGCNNMAALELRPASSMEEAAGASGRFMLRSLTLERLAN